MQVGPRLLRLFDGVKRKLHRLVAYGVHRYGHVALVRLQHHFVQLLRSVAKDAAGRGIVGIRRAHAGRSAAQRAVGDDLAAVELERAEGLPRAVARAEEPVEFIIVHQLALLVDAHGQLVRPGKAAIGVDHGLRRAARHGVQVVRVHAGDAARGRIGGGCAQNVHHALDGHVAAALVEQLGGVLRHHAGGDAVFIQQHLAAGHARLRRDAKVRKRGGVARDQMPADARRDDGMNVRHLVQIEARRDVPVWKQILIPAVRVHHHARGNAVFVDEFADDALDLVHGVRVLELRLAQRHAEVQQVHVRVAKARVHRAPGKVDALHALARARQQLLIRAQRADAAVFHRKRGLRQHAVQRMQPRVVKDSFHQNMLPQYFMVSSRSRRQAGSSGSSVASTTPSSPTCDVEWMNLPPSMYIATCPGKNIKSPIWMSL